MRCTLGTASFHFTILRLFVTKGYNCEIKSHIYLFFYSICKNMILALLVVTFNGEKIYTLASCICFLYQRDSEAQMDWTSLLSLVKWQRCLRKSSSIVQSLWSQSTQSPPCSDDFPLSSLLSLEHFAYCTVAALLVPLINCLNKCIVVTSLCFKLDKWTLEPVSPVRLYSAVLRE